MEIASEGGAFSFRLRGDLYVDSRIFFGEVPAGSEQIFLERARLRLQGTAHKRFFFSILPDFGISGPEIDDAYVGVQFAHWVRVRAGRFKVPIGLENLQSATGLMHPERGFPTAMVPGRDVGAMLTGRLLNERVRYAAGIFNGSPGASGAGRDVDDSKEIAGRLFGTPFEAAGSNSEIIALDGFGVGVGASVGRVEGREENTGLPGFTTSGGQEFFQYRPSTHAHGRRWRLAPQARLFVGPVELLAEYTWLGQTVQEGTTERELTHRSWQASGAVVLTGEDARAAPVEPRRPFGIERGPGALEFGARIHGLDVDAATFPQFAAPTDAASGALAWGLTLSWYPNAVVRVTVGYERTTFETAGQAGGEIFGSEHLILSRLRLAL